jgi:E3 ubiquitin-protein ligase RBX1
MTDIVTTPLKNLDSIETDSAKHEPASDIQSVTFCCYWTYIQNDICPICEMDIFHNCIDCDTGGSCHSVMGECNHLFHFHCIEKWIKTRNVCPLDGKKWECKKYESIALDSKYTLKEKEKLIPVEKKPDEHGSVIADDSSSIGTSPTILSEDEEEIMTNEEEILLDDGDY